MTNQKPITFGSLFSGAGGFDLGLERAGWQCKFQVEWDKYCQQVLQYHWADVPKWEDVQQVNGADLPPVDVIAWGSPCQDLSNAGKRAGLDGEKSSMFFEGIRIIKEMREATNGKYPTISIWENVAGAITSNKGNDFQAILWEMANAGCDHIEWRLLDSQWFRIPQRRRRIFVVAVWDSATTIRDHQQILHISKSSRRYPAQITSAIQNTYTLETYSGTDSQPEPLMIDGTRVNDIRVDDSGVIPTLTARMGTGGNSVPMVVQEVTDLSGSPIAATLRGFGHGWQGQHNSTHTVVQPTDSSLWNGNQVTPTITSSSHRQTMPDKDQWFAVTDNKNIIRKLTEIECERLMGWDDDHTRFRADGKETPSSQRYKMCGNGVVSPVATWIAQRITQALDKPC